MRIWRVAETEEVEDSEEALGQYATLHNMVAPSLDPSYNIHLYKHALVDVCKCSHFLNYRVHACIAPLLHSFCNVPRTYKASCFVPFT